MPAANRVAGAGVRAAVAAQEQVAAILLPGPESIHQVMVEAAIENRRGADGAGKVLFWS